MDEPTSLGMMRLRAGGPDPARPEVGSWAVMPVKVIQGEWANGSSSRVRLISVTASRPLHARRVRKGYACGA